MKITEVTNGGPGGAGDNFFELTNTGDAPVDVTGWQVYRCTGTGRVYDGMLQLNLPDGEMAPGEVFTAARTGADSTVEHPDATYGTSFNAVNGFGLMVVDKDRNVVDSVGVFDRVDSPCTAGEPLSDTLDFASAESYQRVAFTGDNAKDYVRAIRTPGKYDPDVEAIEVQKPKMGDVVINEIAAGRPDDKGGQKAQYIEIINNGSTPADLSGLRVDYCAADGRPMLEPAAVVPDGLSLAPGGVLTVARPEAGVKDALTTDATFQQEGYGATITDAAGTLLDAVGVYYDDVGKVTNAPEGPCSSAGVPLDRRMRFTSIEEAQKHDYAWHRVQSTGDNWADFVTAPATPGSADGPEYRDVTEPVEGSLDPVEVERAARTGVPELSKGTSLTATGTADADVTAFGAKTAAIDWEKSAGFIGASPKAALEQRVGRARPAPRTSAIWTRRKTPAARSRTSASSWRWNIPRTTWCRLRGAGIPATATSCRCTSTTTLLVSGSVWIPRQVNRAPTSLLWAPVLSPISTATAPWTCWCRTASAWRIRSATPTARRTKCSRLRASTTSPSRT